MPKYPNLLAHLRGRGHGVGREGRHGDDHRPQQGVRLQRQGRDRSRKPFLTLYPGDTYNLATRHVISRAVDGRRSSATFIDSLFSKYSDPSAGGATVLVAQNGSVFIDHAFGIPDQTTLHADDDGAAVRVGGITEVFNALCTQIPSRRRGGTPVPRRTAAAAAALDEGAGAAMAAGDAVPELHHAPDLDADRHAQDHRDRRRSSAVRRRRAVSLVAGSRECRGRSSATR